MPNTATASRKREEIKPLHLAKALWYPAFENHDVKRQHRHIKITHTSVSVRMLVVKSCVMAMNWGKRYEKQNVLWVGDPGQKSVDKPAVIAFSHPARGLRPRPQAVNRHHPIYNDPTRPSTPSHIAEIETMPASISAARAISTKEAPLVPISVRKARR